MGERKLQNGFTKRVEECKVSLFSSFYSLSDSIDSKLIFSPLHFSASFFTSSFTSHSPNSILTTLLFSDPSPQGLLEALDSKFNKSSILGLVSPPTPFQTGRSRTMFSNLREDEIHEDGAVGLVLTDGTTSEIESKEESFFKPNVRVDYEGFTTLGPRREITR